MSSTFERLAKVRRRLAVVLLILGLPAYYIAFQLDPWVFGVLLLGLGPAQIGVAALGILTRLVRREIRPSASEWIVDLLLLVAAIAAFVFVRTISWT